MQFPCVAVMTGVDVAPRFSVRRSRRRDLSASSTYHRRGAARMFVHYHRRSLNIVAEVMSSATEAPRLRRSTDETATSPFVQYR